MLKKTIRKYCYWCSGDQPKEIALCPTYSCPFHSLRMGKNPNNLKRLKTIATRCLDCKGGLKKEVKNCDDNSCLLFNYRMGKNPARRGLGNKDIKRYSSFKKSSLSNTKISKEGL